MLISVRDQILQLRWRTYTISGREGSYKEITFRDIENTIPRTTPNLTLRRMHLLTNTRTTTDNVNKQPHMYPPSYNKPNLHAPATISLSTDSETNAQPLLLPLAAIKPLYLQSSPQLLPLTTNKTISHSGPLLSSSPPLCPSSPKTPTSLPPPQPSTQQPLSNATRISFYPNAQIVYTLPDIQEVAVPSGLTYSSDDSDFTGVNTRCCMLFSGLTTILDIDLSRFCKMCSGHASRHRGRSGGWEGR